MWSCNGPVVDKGNLNMTKDNSRYSKLIEGVFLENYKKGAREATFQREDLVKIATKLGVTLPKNLGDIVYREATTDAV